MKKYIFLILLLPFLGFYAGRFLTNIPPIDLKSNNSFDINAASLPYDNEAKKGSVREFDLVAAPTAININNKQVSETWAYNGQIPGPELRVKKGDTIKINFTNNLPVETTIHFHGIRVPNKMDGVPDLTQKAILPGEKFIYEFSAVDAGTFWYHPHVRSKEQVERGLYGTIIVEDPNEPSYSQDKVIVIDDWRILSDGALDENFENMHDIGHDGRWGNVITVNGEVMPDIILNKNERVRLRFVNTSNARIYSLNFGELNAKAIAVDGILAREAFNPNGFELAPGNRIDIDITSPDTPGEYLIRDNFAGFNLKLFNIKVINQDSDKLDFDYPRAEKYPDMDIKNYSIDQEYALDQGGMGMMHNMTATINGKAFPDYADSTINKSQFQVIRFTNSSARLHPMHLHGQFFKVIARNVAVVDEPFMRDTVLVHPHETVDVGIIPIDEGSWALHCHILEHADAGMMTVVEVD